MKWEIFCKPCALKVGAINPLKQLNALDAAMAAQERVSKVYGKLLASCVCDFCGKPLNPGDEVACHTITPMNSEYIPWEADYIEQ